MDTVKMDVDAVKPMVINPKTTDMDAKAKIVRFCYIGNLLPTYRRHRTGIDVKTMFPIIKGVISNMEAVEFGVLVGKLLRDCSLPRKDEAIFLIAVYLDTAEKIECKNNVRHAFPTMIEEAKDLFLFCKYSRLLQEQAERSGFSKTTKKAIVAWYANRNVEELRALWLQNRGLHGFTHKRLIKMCHIKDEVLGDTVVAGAFFKTCTELIKNPLYTTVPSIVCMSTLRTTDRRNEAVKIIKTMRLKFEQVPPKMLETTHVMEAVLPQMTLLEIIKKWHVFGKLGHLEKPKFFKMVAGLTDKQVQMEARIPPIIYLVRMDKLGIPIDEFAKANKKKNEAMRVPYIRKLFFDSFNFPRPVGLRTFIAITLQQNYKKKFLTKSKTITYFQAAAALAFSYFKREKHTDIYAFTEDKIQLKKVELAKRDGFEDAMTTMDKLHFNKSSQRLVQLVINALASGEVYDLIMAIVPSAGRSNPKQGSDLLCKFMDKYRETKNKSAKLVIVSLLKLKDSMRYNPNRNENILEVCGLDEHTIHIIDSFALNRFG